MDLRVDVYHHFDPATTGGGTPSDIAAVLDVINGKLDQIIVAQGAAMTALSDAVDALLARMGPDIQHLQDLVTEANDRAAASAAAEAADATQIATLQAELDAANADAAATVARINAIDPVADFPNVPPDPGADPNPPPADTPPADTPPADAPPADAPPADAPPPDAPPGDGSPPPDAPPADVPPADAPPSP